MDRRNFVAGAVALGAVSVLPGSKLLSQARVVSDAAVNVVERFGFVGDGRTDNYDAFHRLANFANAQGGGHFYFPPGDYWVQRHRTTFVKIRDPREVLNAQYLGCSGLTLRGERANIRLNGRFHRSQRAGPDGVALGVHAGMFMPFEIRRSRNVLISGFEMDGGVREMTRDASIEEGYSYLVALHACTDVTLRDLVLRHSQTDAILLSDDLMMAVADRGQACRDIKLERVRCLNNARGGLAPLQVLGLECVDSAFNGNGFGTGDYGRHAPGFGVCVEPDRSDPGEVDEKTGNLAFTRCDFNDNFSAFLAAYIAHYQGYLRLTDCHSANGNNTPNHIIIHWGDAIMQGGVHDTGEGRIWASWTDPPGGDLLMRDLEVRSAGHFGIYHEFAGSRLRMEGVRLIGRHTKADHGSFPAIEADPGGGRKNVVRNCEFFLPAARKSDQWLYDDEPSFNHSLCENNLFRTDLPASGQHFSTQYGPGTVVRGDRYRGTLPGPEDSFRPIHNSDHDTRLPFSRS